MNRILMIFWKNAESEYGDWGLTGWGWLVLVLVIVFVIWRISHFFNVKSNEEFQAQCEKIKSLGYKDLKDVQVFCNRIDADFDDFIDSKGIRKQYELFAEGKSSNFIEKAENTKKAREAQNTADTAVGLATASIVISSSNIHR